MRRAILSRTIISEFMLQIRHLIMQITDVIMQTPCVDHMIMPHTLKGLRLLSKVASLAQAQHIWPEEGPEMSAP